MTDLWKRDSDDRARTAPDPDTDTDTDPDTEQDVDAESGPEPGSETGADAASGSLQDVDPSRVVTLGLIAEPDMPRRVVEHLSDELPEDIDGSERDWTYEIAVDSLAAGRNSADEILVAAAEMKDARDWDYAIVVTDLPLRDEWRAILAHVDAAAGVAVVCLPALGAAQPFRRSAQMTKQVIDDLTGHANRSAGPDRSRARHGLRSWLTRFVAPIRRLPVEEGQPEQMVRYSAAKRRGLARLLAGMVRTNRPWRLVYSLSGAGAAALATSAFGLSSSTIWQISTQTGTWRILVAAIASVLVLTGWLIAYHDLWESRNRGATDREMALLYNASTVVTLLVGVACMFATLLLVNIAISVLLVPMDLMSSTLSTSVSWNDYVQLALGFTTMGMVAGALGSSFETDEAVRHAAYGYRERRRRAQHSEN